MGVWKERKTKGERQGRKKDEEVERGREEGKGEKRVEIGRGADRDGGKKTNGREWWREVEEEENRVDSEEGERGKRRQTQGGIVEGGRREI